jgi:hypothetical protein
MRTLEENGHLFTCWGSREAVPCTHDGCRAVRAAVALARERGYLDRSTATHGGTGHERA